jgi:hypothetical protein
VIARLGTHPSMADLRPLVGHAGYLRQLALPIVAHGVANTLALVLVYLDRYPGL